MSVASLTALLLLSGVAVGSARSLARRPALWDRPGAPEVAFASALALQLLWLAWLHTRPLHLDVDTAKQIELLAASPTLADVLRMRGVWSADYLLQGPLLHGLRRLLPLEALDLVRGLTLAGAVASACLLRAIARRLGAGDWTSVVAGLVPVASFGGAWLVLSLDDNVVASALQWGFFLALAGALGGAAAADGRRSVARALGAGVLLGIAVSYHRKALLFAPLLVLAPLVAAEFRSRAALRAVALAGCAALVVHGLVAALLLPDGIPANLARLLRSPHHAHPAWWTPAGDVGLVERAGLVLDGLRASLTLFPVLSERVWGSGARPTDVLLALFVAAAGAAAWRTRSEPLCRLLGAGLLVQIAHSVLYEPWSVERWDVVVAGAGALGAVAAASGGAPAQIAVWALSMLLGLQVLGLRAHPAF